MLIRLPQIIYTETLTVLNGIKFSPREIDIISFVVHGRTSKIISQFFSISQKTVEAHIYNIMQKLSCNSREGIRQFVEKSGKFSAVKSYYSNLYLLASFEKNLLNLFENHKDRLSVNLIENTSSVQEELTLKHLEKHLKLIGIKVSTKQKRIDEWIKKASTHSKKSVISYSHPQSNNSDLFKEHPNLHYIKLDVQTDYYQSVFEILKKLFPTSDITQTIKDFEEEMKTIVGDSIKVQNDPPQEINHTFKPNSVKILFKVSLGFLALIFTVLVFKKEELFLKIQPSELIRPELIFPPQASQLERPKLITQIDHLFKGKEAIETIALVGIGGAGKTTLARQYAKTQKASIIWEINAENNTTIFESFLNLASAICKTEVEKQFLMSLQNLKNKSEQNNSLLNFIKKHLKSESPWLLIYDNVYDLETLQDFFPNNQENWGEGKIIITTNNENISNYPLINNIIFIPQLSLQEKITLFAKILWKNPTYQDKKHQSIIENFVKNLPSFPLDVYIAASYIRATNVSFETYLDHLNESSKEFQDLLSSMQNKKGYYNKTRESIIFQSIKQLINVHKDFSDLLLITSLLNSQNIPRQLLEKFKSPFTVDSFIYHLKKYSLILTEEPKLTVSSTISLHRETQKVIKKYLMMYLEPPKIRYALNQFLICSESYLFSIEREENFPKMISFIKHFESLLNHKDIIDKTNKALIKHYLGKVYLIVDDYVKAKNYLENSLELFDNSLPKYQPKVALTLMYLGLIHNDTGQYIEAINLFNKSLKLYQDCGEHTSWLYASTLTHLGNALIQVRQYKSAISQFHESIKLFKKDNLKRNEPYIAWTLASMAEAHAALEENNQAINLLNESLNTYNQQIPINHIRISWVEAKLGAIYTKLGDFKKAEILLKKSYDTSIRYLPKDHIRIANIMTELGILFEVQGKSNQALEWFNKSLVTINEQKIPDNHILRIKIKEHLKKIPQH